MNIEDEIKTLEKAIPLLNIPIKILGVAHTNDRAQQIEIEYLFNGRCYNELSQSIEEASSHKIRFVIGFGYPHLPPRCYPLTHVFHPAFDKDTIQIQDFWETSKSFVELIFYIGKLISGQKTTVEHPFNLMAVKWYKEHLYELPFSSDNLSYTLNMLLNKVYHGVDTKTEIKNLPIQSATQQAKTSTSTKVVVKQKKKSFFQASFPVYAALFAVVFFCCLYTGLSYYEASKLSSAELTLRECEQFVQVGRYREALELCSSVESDLTHIYKSRGEKTRLVNEAKHLIASQRVVERMNIQEKEEKPPTVPNIDRLTNFISAGRNLYSIGDYAEAYEAYKKAQNYVDNETPAESVKELTSALSDLEFLLKIESETKKLNLNSDFNKQQMLSQIDSWRSSLRSLYQPEIVQKEYEDFRTLVNTYDYCRRIIQLFQRKNYPEVQLLFETISESNENFFNTPDGVAIEILAVKATVYTNLTSGKKAYDKSDWKEAVESFSKSLKSLEHIQNKLSDLNFSFTNADTREIEELYKYSRVMYARSAVNYKFEVGEFYEQRKDRQNARREYEDALKVFADFPNELSSMRAFKRRIEEKLLILR